MVKSFLNAFFGGIGRTLGKFVVYIIIALIFFFIYENAHAEEININSSVYGDTGYSNMYWGQNYYNGSLSNSNFSIGTRYSGRLADFVLDIRRSFVANTVYSIYVYAPTNDFRNTLEGVIVDDISNTVGCTTVSSQFMSKTKLKSTFVCPQNTSRIQMQWYADEGSYLTGDTNFNINKITLETQTSSGSNNDDIINSANQNTEDIINNNNSNTQDILDGLGDLGSSITDSTNAINDTIDSTFTCTNLWNDKNNSVWSDNHWVYQTITITQSGTYYFKSNYSHVIINGSHALPYSVTLSAGTYTIYFGSTTSTIDSTISKSMVSLYDKPYCVYGGTIMSETNDNLSDINDSINDKSEMDTSIFSTWWSNFNPGSNPLGNVITLPITLAQKIVGFNENSCQSVNLGALLGSNLILPCFTLSGVLPNNASTLINTIDIIMSISLLVVIIKNSYETIANLISLGGENEVKKQFRLPTPLEFLSNLLNGGGN